MLAPYTALLEYRTRRTEMEAFIGAIMPPLVEEGFARNTLPRRLESELRLACSRCPEHAMSDALGVPHVGRTLIHLPMILGD